MRSLKNMGSLKFFNKFILTECISVKKCYSCTFIFSSKKNMVSSPDKKIFKRNAYEAVEHTKKTVSYHIADQIHSM